MMGFMDAVYRVSPACNQWDSASACMPLMLSPAGLKLYQFSTWHPICNACTKDVHTSLLNGPHQMLTEATYLSGNLWRPLHKHHTAACDA